MKIFARFLSKEEFESLINNLTKEKFLREVIEQLKFFKQKGLDTIDQIEQYIDSYNKKK